MLKALVWVGVGLSLAACSSNTTGDDGGADGAMNGGDGSASDTGTGGDGNGNTDTGTGNDSGTGGDSGGGSCVAANLTSACGYPQSIVRALVTNTLASATGTLRVGINHYRLGSGASGGVPHVETAMANATVGSMATQVNFDMCSNGEMWSEEDCEFSLWAYVDKNNNMQLDQGEPAGKTVVSISCHAAGQQCFNVSLTCMAGASCLSFSDPGACTCKMPSCPTPAQLKYCQ
jgi:hypothetical protein